MGYVGDVGIDLGESEIGAPCDSEPVDGSVYGALGRG